MSKQALIADIGGTNARFALADKDGLHDEVWLECKSHASLQEAAHHYLGQVGGNRSRPELGIFAVAAPIVDDLVNFSSNSWSFRQSTLSKDLGFSGIEVMNDFVAVAKAIPDISRSLLRPLADIPLKDHAPKAVVGVGTGLGVANLFWTGDRYIEVPGEGGHHTMAATTQREFDIFQQLRVKYHHISTERVCSGKGLENLYAAIRALDKKHHLPDITAPEISVHGIEGTCEVSREALDLMLAFLGRAAGNIALTTIPEGGLFIAGGIPVKLGDYFFKSRFYEEFTHKGRMSDLMKKIPVHVIKHDAIGMIGLENYARSKLL